MRILLAFMLLCMSSVAEAAITIQSEQTSSGQTNASDGTFTVTKPGTITNGDYVVVIIGKGDDPDVAPPAGFTTANELGSASGNDTFTGIYWKYITNAAGETNYTFDSAGTSEGFGAYAASISGIDTSTPEDVDFDTGSGAWVKRANDTSPNAPAVTTVTNDAMAFACWEPQSDADVTMPGGSWNTEAEDIGSGTGWLSVASQTFPTGGTSTGTPEITNVGSGSDETNTGMFVFRPASTTVSWFATID